MMRLDAKNDWRQRNQERRSQAQEGHLDHQSPADEPHEQESEPVSKWIPYRERRAAHEAGTPPRRAPGRALIRNPISDLGHKIGRAASNFINGPGFFSSRGPHPAAP